MVNICAFESKPVRSYVYLKYLSLDIYLPNVQLFAKSQLDSS